MQKLTFRPARIKISEAVRLAVQIAEALDEAHAKGIIHRDIKSSNLIITPRRQVKVLDFGLTKINRDGLKREETIPGRIMGTVHYMSPEQARGLAVDSRTDIFSLGVVLYEMVNGQRPFDGPTASDVLSAILEREPKPLAGIPAGIARVIGKCLEKNPENRYAKVSDLIADLELVQNGTSKTTATPRLRIAIAAVVALAVIGVAGTWIRPRAPVLTERDSILLADSVNTTDEPAFDGTLRDALAIQLEQSPYLNIVPRDRVRETLRYMGRAADERVTGDVAREIRRRENAKAMLGGSIAALGTQYVMTLDAVNCQTGESLAREQKEASSKEGVLRALGQAASSLRAALGESLSSIQTFDVPIERATTASFEALRAYSLGEERRLPETTARLSRFSAAQSNWTRSSLVLIKCWHGSTEIYAKTNWPGSMRRKHLTDVNASVNWKGCKSPAVTTQR